MPGVQKRPLPEPEVTAARQLVLPQNVRHWSCVLRRRPDQLRRCESCIDRLFTLGPAPCPICSKVLRKLAFTPQTFEDLSVEKEVAVRRRIAKEYVLPALFYMWPFNFSSGLTSGETIFPTCVRIMTTWKKSKTSVSTHCDYKLMFMLTVFPQLSFQPHKRGRYTAN